jgi:hypothetical protein
MNFKTILLSAALINYTMQVHTQVTDPVMPTDPTTTTAPDIIMPNTIPDSMPDESQAPTMMPVSNIIQEPQQMTQPPLVTNISAAQTTLVNPPSLTTQTQQVLPSPLNEQKKSTANSKPKSKNTKIINIKPQEGTLTNSELDFEVENQTGKTIYITCFSYIKKRPFSRWRWDKSPVYKIEDNKTVVVDLDTIADEEDRNNTFGYLGIFENKKDAEESTFELLNDNQKIDLDIIAQLHDKKVTIEIEKYGIVGEFYDFDFKDINKEKEDKKIPELDFYVENKTGKTIFVTCFVYEKKAKGTWLAKKTKEAWTSEEETRDDMTVWRFDKTPVIKIKPNERGLIDVDTIVEPRDRVYVRGYLAIFDEDEQELAEKSIYELMQSRRKLDIGKLIDLKHKKITVYTERYGAMGNFIDYVVKPTQKPDIKKIITGYLK